MLDWQQEVGAAWGVTVEGLHGRGGNADVYAATQHDLGRRVALKVIQSSPAAPDVHERFRREARTVAMLVHPHIVPIYNFGVFGSAMVIMMPWYETSLADAIRTHPLPTSDARRLLDELRSALEHAHAQGVVHRDVKPSNIMIAASGAFVLADFGIAAVRDQTQLTRTGVVPGTPDYLAPEVIMGEPPGPAADLYALGATLFEATSGTKVFPAHDPVSAAYQHVHGTPPRLDVPADPHLAATIAALLSKDPAEREQTASPERGGQRPDPAGTDTPGPQSRRSSTAWKAALGLGLLGALGTVALSILNRPPSAIMHAEVLEGRVVSVELNALTGCPRTSERLSVGEPGEVARVSRVTQWAASPVPSEDVRLLLGGRSVEATLDNASGRVAVVATLPGDLSGSEGTLTYLDSQGERHQHRVSVPEQLRWASLAVTRDGAAPDLIAAGPSLQDGAFESGVSLASPGGLSVGLRGNASVTMRTARKANFVYLGAVLDAGLAIEAPRVADVPLQGTAYVRLCPKQPCGQETPSELVELVAATGAGRSAYLSPAVRARELRFVWPAGSDGRDTRLHEVCGLVMPPGT